MKKRTAVKILSFLSAAVVALGAFAYSQNQELVYAKRVNEIYGERALNDLTESLTSMDESLRKSQYANSAPLLSRLYTDASTYAASAVTALGGLPYSTYELERTSRFINAAGDYVLSLSRAASEGELPDEETAAHIAELSNTLRTVAEGFSQVRQELSDRALCLDGYGTCSDDGEENTVGSELRSLEEKMPEFPELTYDGQFSALADKGETGKISEDKAKRAAAVFLGVPEQRLTMAGECRGELPCLYFNLSTADGEEQQIAVTAQTGKIAEWSNSHRPDSGNVSEEEASAKAAEFLDAHGYGGMTELSRKTEGGICEVSFACSDGDALCVNETVQVSVALDNGEVCALIAGQYLKNHEETHMTPAVSAEEASQAVPPSLTQVSSRLVLTKTAGIKKSLCYEIACKNDEGEEIVIFVDAMTGKQKMIELKKT